MGYCYTYFAYPRFGKLNLLPSPGPVSWFADQVSGFLVWLHLVASYLSSGFCQIF